MVSLVKTGALFIRERSWSRGENSKFSLDGTGDLGAFHKKEFSDRQMFGLDFKIHFLLLTACVKITGSTLTVYGPQSFTLSRSKTPIQGKIKEQLEIINFIDD